MAIICKPNVFVCLEPHTSLHILGSKMDSAIVIASLFYSNPFLRTTWNFKKLEVQGNLPDYGLFATFLVPKLDLNVLG